MKALRKTAIAILLLSFSIAYFFVSNAVSSLGTVTCQRSFPSMDCHNGQCNDPDEALACILSKCVQQGNIFDLDCYSGRPKPGP